MEWVVKSIKLISKQLTCCYIIKKINMVHKQNKKNEKETFITRKARKKTILTLTNKKKTHSPKLRTPSFLSHHTNTTSRNTLKHT